MCPQTTPSTGSSPRARGTEHDSVGIRRHDRFIPASAGNGRSTPCMQTHSPVHPRERGERIKASRASRRKSGSSPRARGTERFPPCRCKTGRFIPASAGNGSLNAALRACASVHPRERGERTSAAGGLILCRGSSPRARGTGRRHGGGDPRQRFIPASAGNGDDRLKPECLILVHPRERGERGLISEWVEARGGSSPRARGTAEIDCVPRGGWRFIPASAGNGGG